VELTCDDRGGRGGSGEAVSRTRERESSSGGRMHRRSGGTGGHMVSGSNEQRSQRHGKEAHDVPQMKAVVERRHQRENTSSQKGKMKKTDFGGSIPGEGRAPEVDSAVQEPNAKLLPAEPEGSQGVGSSMIRQLSCEHDHGGLNPQRRQENKPSHGERGNAEV